MSGLGKWIIFSEDFAQKWKIFLCIEKKIPQAKIQQFVYCRNHRHTMILPNLCMVCVVRQERCLMLVLCAGEFQVW